VCGSVGGGSANHNGGGGGGGPAGGFASGAASFNASGNGENQYYRNAVKGSRIYNCRNPWFRLFWEQHFKCRFNSSSSAASGHSSSTLPECKGGDKLTYYEQEGLVPFVGKLLLLLFSIRWIKKKKKKKKNSCNLSWGVE
jgi:hypothetical protein